MGNLGERAMLVNLTISQWRAQKHDKKVSDEVATNYQATSEVGRYNKFLVDRREVKAIMTVGSEARTYHYRLTLPWMDNGMRILTSMAFPEYSATMKNLEGRFWQAVNDFYQVYPGLISQAKGKLNGMYNQGDYPAVGKLHKKYGFGLSFYPLPDGKDFRVSLAEDEAKEIRENIERDTAQAITDGMRDLYVRLGDVVRSMAVKLSDPEGKFRDSLVRNITSLCMIIPKLNLTGDAQLENLRRQVESDLTKYDPDTLKEDGRARKETADKASEILKRIEEVMG